jgi:chemotaxis protein MotB
MSTHSHRLPEDDSRFSTAATDPGDPWHSTAPDHSSDPSSWLLSYSDVMTLLFAFFILLFAHQKILIEEPAKIAKIHAVVQAAAAPARKTESKAAAPAAVPKPEAPVSEALPPAAADTPAVQESGQSGQKPDVVSTAPQPPAPAPLESGWLARPEPVAVAAIEPPKPWTPGFSETEWGKAVEFSAAEGQVRLEINDSILFDPASAKLKPQGSIVLDQLVHWLNLQAGQVEVEGHTDNRPISTARFHSNWELSSARASTVTRYLIAHGLPPERLKAVGLADTQPRAGNDTPEGRTRNRRVSLVIYVPREGGVNI